MNEAVIDCTAANFIEDVLPMRSLSHPLSHTEVSPDRYYAGKMCVRTWKKRQGSRLKFL